MRELTGKLWKRVASGRDAWHAFRGQLWEIPCSGLTEAAKMMINEKRLKINKYCCYLLSGSACSGHSTSHPPCIVGYR